MNVWDASFTHILDQSSKGRHLFFLDLRVRESRLTNAVWRECGERDAFSGVFVDKVFQGIG